MKYLDEPKETRTARRQQRKAEREPLLQRWFGVLPMTFSLWREDATNKLRILIESRRKTN